MGDFNLDLLRMQENQHINDFTNMMFSPTFYPLISRPTRITNTTAALIDNIFVNNIEGNYKCGILFTDLSDHLPVFLKTSNFQRFKGTVSRFGACPYYIFACARFIARPAFSLFMNQSEASCLISHANSHEIINRGINPTGQN